MSDLHYIHVDGTPAPQGSKRHVGRGILVESSKLVKPWRAAVAAAAQASNLAGLMLNGPIQVRMSFYLRRPAGHFGKRGLLPSAPPRPDRKPDLDKLVRSTLDGLATDGCVIADDARIVSIRASKHYCTDDRPMPGADIWVGQA